MALISCPECGKEISDKAFACPHCGNPMNPQPQQVQNPQQITKSADANAGRQKKPSKAWSKVLLAVILVIAIIGGGWYFWKNHDDGYSLEGLAKALPNYDIDKTDSGLCLPDFHEGLAMVKKGDKYGFIDKTGKEVIPTIYDAAGNFHEGLAIVKKDDKWGFIDKTGKEIAPCIYDDAGDFHEGLAVIQKDGKRGFIDKTGKEVTPMIYDEAGEFYDGLAMVGKEYDNGDSIECEGGTIPNISCKYGFIDKTGKEVIPMIYDQVFDFHEGLAQVSKGNAYYGTDKFGFIDKTGKEVTPIIYDFVHEFHEGIAQVRIEDYKDGYIIGNKYGFIDKTGKEVTPTIYDFAYDFHEGLAWVEKGDKWGFIDITGKEITPMIYDEVKDFLDGLAMVKKGNKYGFIDKTGKEVTPMIYDDAGDIHEGLAMVKKDGKCGFIDKTGKEIVSCIYSECSNFSEGLAFVANENGVLGVVDKTGKSTFDVVNDRVQPKIENQEEVERKRIEEENSPATKFYNIASQNYYVWEARNHHFDVLGVDVLYFYPVSKTEGLVSIIRQTPDYNSWYVTFSMKTNYRVVGNNIIFSASGVWGRGIERTPWITNYNMTIEMDGNEIRLVNNQKPHYETVYHQKRHPMKDPL